MRLLRLQRLAAVVTVGAFAVAGSGALAACGSGGTAASNELTIPRTAGTTR